MWGLLFSEALQWGPAFFGGAGLYYGVYKVRKAKRVVSDLKEKYRIRKEEKVEEKVQEAILLDYCEGCEQTVVPDSMGWTDEGPLRMGEWRCPECRARYKVFAYVYNAAHQDLAQEHTSSEWFCMAKKLCDQYEIDYPESLGQWCWDREQGERDKKQREEDEYYAKCMKEADEAERIAQQQKSMKGKTQRQIDMQQAADGDFIVRPPGYYPIDEDRPVESIKENFEKELARRRAQEVANDAYTRATLGQLRHGVYGPGEAYQFDEEGVGLGIWASPENKKDTWKIYKITDNLYRLVNTRTREIIQESDNLSDLGHTLGIDTFSGNDREIIPSYCHIHNQQTNNGRCGVCEQVGMNVSLPRTISQQYRRPGPV